MNNIKNIKDFINEKFNDKLFRSEKDKELWIRLNAERQIDFDKNSRYSNRLHPRSMEQALAISRRQCEIDEELGKLRFSFEELLSLDYPDLSIISDQNHKEWIEKIKKIK